MGTTKSKKGKGKKLETKDSAGAQDSGEVREIALLKAQLVRALADYDNLTKRYNRDSEQFGTIARSQMLVTLMPALDMIDSAQSHLQDAGLAMGVVTLLQSLTEQGFERIAPGVGEQFDEQFHEAVEVVSEKGKENGEIIEILLSGWKLVGGQAIRPAKVKVNRVERKNLHTQASKKQK